MKPQLYKALIIKLFLIIIIALPSCKKYVQIDPPASSVKTEEVFKDSANANAAILGIYTYLATTGTHLSFANGNLTIYCGSSADELVNFNPYSEQLQFYLNTLTNSSQFVDDYFWTPAYQVIYQTNACIEGVTASSKISGAAKSQFIGEAKFLRALCHFYLVNLFASVPYITSTDYKMNSLIGNIPVNDVYMGITSDLLDARMSLKQDFSMSNNERIRANSWAATALLARVYLYQQKWDSAELCASGIINNPGLFSLNTNLNNVFLTNNPEAILQWNINTSVSNNVTPEGFNLIPYDSLSQPYYYLSNQLLASFEPGDLRRKAWVDSTDYLGTFYYYPYKYKTGPALYSPNTAPTEYYMVLRLGEQYLIRAEARAKLGNVTGAVDDLNAIRVRAGLATYNGLNSQAAILSAIWHERQIELFAEWGHRWFDLKRTGTVDSVMTIVTPQKNGGGKWNSFQKLYPIPVGELLLNPNLKQNPGYN